MMRLIRFLFGSEHAAATLAHKAIWTAVQSGTGVLMADGLLPGMGLSVGQTVAVAALSGIVTVVKEFSRKQLAPEDA